MMKSSSIEDVNHKAAAETFPAAIQALQSGAIDGVVSELPVALGDRSKSGLNDCSICRRPGIHSEYNGFHCGSKDGSGIPGTAGGSTFPDYRRREKSDDGGSRRASAG